MWGKLVQAETEEVQRFITFYDAIRSDKKAPISRRDLDISFLEAQFDRFFFLGWEGEALFLNYAAPKLVDAYDLGKSTGPLSDMVSPEGLAELTLLFEEMHQCPDRGVLARFRKAKGDPSQSHELVMLPVVAPGKVTAIGVAGPLDGAEAGEKGTSPGQRPREHLPLLQKSCFDLRVPLPPRGEGFLVQCITALGKLLLGKR